MFKNLSVYRLTAPIGTTADELEAKLAPLAFVPTSSVEMTREGWLSPRENGKLVHVVNQQILLSYGTEKKLLPGSVITQFTKAKAADLTEQQGFAPGRKQMKELKEQVTDELMPRAFNIQGKTSVWIDPVNGWLVIDTSASGKADAVIKLLLKSFDRLPLAALRVGQSPIAAMTHWLASDEAPQGFTVDQDTELRSRGENKSTVRYVKHTLEVGDIAKHIESGKQCTRLALTWADRISFVLTENLSIKRIAPLDVLKENTDTTGRNDDERFDGDMALMTGELAKMLGDIVEALGGLVPDQAAA